MFFTNLALKPDLEHRKSRIWSGKKGIYQEINLEEMKMRMNNF